MSEFVDVLLAESELSDDMLLRELLGELERETTTVRPMPSATLSALMSPKRPLSAHVSTRGARRRPSFAARSAIIASAAVIGVVALGAGAAAASPATRSAIDAGVAAIAHLFEPSHGLGTHGTTKHGAHPPETHGIHQHLSRFTPSDGTSEADHASRHQRDGSQNGDDPNSESNAGSGLASGDTKSDSSGPEASGSGETGSGGSGSGESGSGSAGSDSSEQSGDKNSGDSHGGDGGGHGGGRGGDDGGRATNH